MQGHFAIEASGFFISGASMRLGYHSTLTETFLFVMNVLENKEGFENLSHANSKANEPRAEQKIKDTKSILNS
jgi:hypothetical protein